MANSLTDIVKIGSRTIHKKVVDNKIKYVPTNLEGTVIYYPMEEKTINLTLDHSGHNNHGTIYGAIECAGKIGKGLQFDGVDDYVDSGNVIDVTNKLTIISWVKTEVGCMGNIVGKFENNNKRWHIFVYDGANQIYWNIGGNNFATSPANVLRDVFHHVVMVYDGELVDNVNRLKCYIDGSQIVLNFTGTIPEIMPAIVGNVRIGRHDTNYFKGKIDEARVYNRALTEQEILASYQQEL